MRNTAGTKLRKPGSGSGLYEHGVGSGIKLEGDTMSDKITNVEKTDLPKSETNLNQQLWKEMAVVATRDQTEDPTKNRQQTMHSLSEALKSNWYGLDSDRNGFVTLPEIEFYEKHKAPDSQTRQAISFFRENGGLISQYANDRGKAGVTQAHMGISEADRRVFEIISDPNKQTITIASQDLASRHFIVDSLVSGAAGGTLGGFAPLAARGLMSTGRIAESGILGKSLTTVGARSPYLAAAIGAVAIGAIGTYAAYKWHQSSYEKGFRSQQSDLFKLTLPTQN